jgi:hypothetical protein
MNKNNDFMYPNVLMLKFVLIFVFVSRLVRDCQLNDMKHMAMAHWTCMV